jgi:hypothetical protein
MKKKSLLSLLSLGAVAVATPLLLSACGGGGDDQPAATVAVPAEVSQSPVSFYAYVTELTVSTNTDDLPPVSLAAVTNPPEDNDGPANKLQ